MSIALGNKKPERLIEVEKLMWRALFILSEGTKAPEAVLGDLLLQFPWETFQPPSLSISQQDSEWFVIQATPLSAAPAQKILSVPSTSTSPPPVPAVSDNSSPPPNDNPMDQSPDYQPQPPIPNPHQSMESEISASGTTDFEGFGAMDKDTPSDGPTPHARELDELDSRTQASPTVSDPVAPSYRRSTRLALEKSKEDSLRPETSESHSRSTSPIELSIPKSNQHKPTTALKRKAPTGERDVEISISAGGSHAKPIGCSQCSLGEISNEERITGMWKQNRQMQHR